MDVSHAPPELQAKAAEMFPKSRTSILAAYEAGVKIAVGTDAPAIPHGKNADELVTLVDWGLPPLAVLRAATVTAAELINATDRGRLAPGPARRYHRGAGKPVGRHHRYPQRQLCHERRQGLCQQPELTTWSRSSSCSPATRSPSPRKTSTGLSRVFTPDGTYSAFGDTYRLDRFPELVAAAPKGLFLTGTAVVDIDGDTAHRHPAAVLHRPRHP